MPSPTLFFIRKPKLCYWLLATSLLTLPVEAGVLAWLGITPKAVPSSNSHFLPVEQAFVLTSHQEAEHLQLNFAIEPGYYLYRHSIAASATGAQLGDVSLPQGKAHQDQYFGESQVYYQQVTLPLPVTAITQGATVTVSYQGCTTDLCYAPQKVSIPLLLEDER